MLSFKQPRFCLTLAFALFQLSFVLADDPINPGFPYGRQKVRGVNIGGWLLLEPWITPSLFDNTCNPNIIDEWTFAQLQDRATATAALQRHWSTFISEDDFAQIAAAGCVHRLFLLVCGAELISFPSFYSED